MSLVEQIYNKFERWSPSEKVNVFGVLRLINYENALLGSFTK